MRCNRRQLAEADDAVLVLDVLVLDVLVLEVLVLEEDDVVLLAEDESPEVEPAEVSPVLPDDVDELFDEPPRLSVL